MSTATKTTSKATTTIDDQLRAPIQDMLVLKNHRREQSANATANRYNKNDHWGAPDAEDIRRADSCDRAEVD